jgi:sucrose-6-phosphatase
MSLPPIKLFCSDVDGTLLGNPEAAGRFKMAWEALPIRRRPILCYSTGRLIADMLAILDAARLPWPDFVVAGVGTQLYEVGRKRSVEEFSARFGQGWSSEEVERILAGFPGIERQPPEFLHPYKSSWYLRDASPETLAEIRSRLEAAGLKATVVYSSARDLDVLPAAADKGKALQWLCQRLQVPLDRALVAGDTANDGSMFLLPGVRGIVVENAQPELFEAVVHLPTFTATRPMADGVLQGLEHYGVIAAAPALHRAVLSPGDLEGGLSGFLEKEAYTTLDAGERAVVAEGYRRALTALRKNITPAGFSACSLNDNDVVGTDVNYRSVWARDGAIVIVGTAELDDDEIQAAQRATLQTLLDRIAPNGQVPANVRIETGKPDYSGVGGICAIDGALWVVVALYHYVQTQEDWALIEQYAGPLDRVMQWLCALDCNNDGLLEIPEAGDWTDLFGRSYHVLYDEVMWYRAALAYGRLLEFQRRFEEAGSWLRTAQRIRSTILQAFWPSTRATIAPDELSFSRPQSSVGDASYLLAEITPFGFNWRCDVFANIQAFLGNVLDIDRARIAFKFMWGVGVNEPFPVANLYPAVQSGDPDWRSYYTVNLLNLPGHYHNGGIWPFIGGMWVRFIHRLGLRDIACRELFKLAQVNRLGKNQEWEFNEWLHSRTGRPMGKCFQAWSASSYLHACHDLQLGISESDEE